MQNKRSREKKEFSEKVILAVHILLSIFLGIVVFVFLTLCKSIFWLWAMILSVLAGIVLIYAIEIGIILLGAGMGVVFLVLEDLYLRIKSKIKDK